MTVLISMPTYRTPQAMLDKAVQSVLAQTFTDFRLVIIGDGEEPNVNVNDDRVVVFTLPENRGRYFADAVTQQANPFDWWAVHDSDDWAEPYWLRTLFRHRRDGVAWSYLTFHHRHNGSSIKTYPNRLQPFSSSHRTIACHIGLYAMDRIQQIGGSHPDHRMSYDTLMCNLYAMTGPTYMVPKSLYHRRKRDNSLTTSNETGLHTQVRRDARVPIKHLYNQALRLYQRKRSERIADLINDSINEKSAVEVAEQAQMLRKELL